MKLELVNRLLEVEMTIFYKGKTKIIDKLVIDTGAAHTLLSSDIVEDIGISLKMEILWSVRTELAVRECFSENQLILCKLGTHEISEMKLDFENLDDWGIHGLIGLNILMNGKFIIDLEKLELVQNH